MTARPHASECGVVLDRNGRLLARTSIGTHCPPNRFRAIGRTFVVEINIVGDGRPRLLGANPNMPLQSSPTLVMESSDLHAHPSGPGLRHVSDCDSATRAKLQYCCTTRLVRAVLILLDITCDCDLSLFEVGHRRIGATCKALTECAVTRETNNGLAFDTVPHISAKAATFHSISHSVLHPDMDVDDQLRSNVPGNRPVPGSLGAWQRVRTRPR